MIEAIISVADKKQNVIQYEEKRRFRNIKDAVSGVKEEFGIKGKTQPMYIDKKRQKKGQIGQEVGFIKNTWGRYDDTHQRFPEEIWVSFNKITPLNYGRLKKVI